MTLSTPFQGRIGREDTTDGQRHSGLISVVICTHSEELGSEETELCIRAARAGARITTVPSARIRHIVLPERTNVEYLVCRAWSEGRSKALITAIHGRVLGLEQRYTGALLRDTARLMHRAIVSRDRMAARQALGLIAALGTAASGYAAERLRPV